MNKHRPALPAITRDAVTGEHRAIAVDYDDRGDDAPETDGPCAPDHEPAQPNTPAR